VRLASDGKQQGGGGARCPVMAPPHGVAVVQAASALAEALDDRSQVQPTSVAYNELRSVHPMRVLHGNPAIPASGRLAGRSESVLSARNVAYPARQAFIDARAEAPLTAY